MKPRPSYTARSPRGAQASALCVAAALGLAVFYHGPQMPLLAGAQFLLIVWLVLSLVTAYPGGIRVPLTPLSIALTLFWLWLGISLLWSAVPATSIINFWWVGSLVLTFWAYTLSPQRERIWFYASRFVPAGALLLCVYALAQLAVWRLPPRATFVNIHSFAALLMLVALPLAAHFLEALHNGASRLLQRVLGAGLFVLFFTIAATDGRGSTLSIVLGLATLAAFGMRAVGGRPVALLVGLFGAAYVAAHLLLHGGLTGARIATLVDPAGAAAPRLLIWQGSWEMLTAHPWWGIGLGTYYLAWPPYRHPDDTSLGFFAHNDYLQLWIEAGLPALLLLLAVYVSVLVMLVRLLRRPRLAVGVRLEVLGLFTGLLAVAAHSFVDFNLYILPISILAGLLLGRFHECAENAERLRAYVLRPARTVQRRAYGLIVALLALFPLSYFVALGTSDYLYKRGLALAAEGKLPEADRAFAASARLMPGDDKVLIVHADLYRHVLGRLPPAAAAERHELYEAALTMLERAESFNVYRPLIHVVRARILQENADLTGSDWRARVESGYAKALALDPRFFTTRLAYARLLLRAGRETDAYRLLHAGLEHWYYPSQPLLAYYEFAAQLATRLGEEPRARELAGRIEAVRRSVAALAPARPVVPDLVSPVGASAH